jgi:tRNA (cmo5U34)-methyltransferase
MKTTKTNQPQKSTVEEITAKFDQLADRYSNIETGQSSALDSPLCMKLITESAVIFTSDAKDVIDIGCGGGNYIVKLTQLLPDANCTLIDLSEKMLNRAFERVRTQNSGSVTTIRGDIRKVDLKENSYDIIMAATVLHHLRTSEEWELVFSKIYKSLRKGGSFWINDVIIHENEEMNKMMTRGWCDTMKTYMTDEEINWCIDQYNKEDTPQTLNLQLDLMKKVGFRETHILHKHFNFAAFGAIK